MTNWAGCIVPGKSGTLTRVVIKALSILLIRHFELKTCLYGRIFRDYSWKLKVEESSATCGIRTRVLCVSNQIFYPLLWCLTFQERPDADRKNLWPLLGHLCVQGQGEEQEQPQAGASSNPGQHQAQAQVDASPAQVKRSSFAGQSRLTAIFSRL